MTPGARRPPDRSRWPRWPRPTGAGCCTSRRATSPGSRPWTWWARSWPTSRPRCSRRRSPWPGPNCRAGAAPCRLAVVAMGKCGGRELNYASDVDVIFVAEPPSTDEDETAALAHRQPAGGRADRRVRAVHPRRQHLPGRPEPAPGRPGRPAGPHAGQPPGLLRALGQDLGVPGAAQGPAGGRRHGARPGVRGHPRPAGLAGGPPRAFRRGRAGHAPPGGAVTARPSRPGASSSSVPAGCATSSSPSSCCSWCTAAPTRRCARPRRCPRWPRWPPAATSAGPTRRSSAAAYRFLRRTEHLLQLHRLSRTHTLPEDPAVLRRLGRAMRLQ